MKNLLSILSIALLLCSCVNSTKQSATEGATDASIDSLSGEWVIEGYKNELLKNISPMKMGEILTGNTGVCISKSQGDSAFVLILINNHEAISGYIYKKQAGKKGGSFAFKSDFESNETIDIKFDDSKDNKTLILYTYDEAGKAISSERFEYVTDFKDINDPCGLTAVNLLLADKWALLDAKDKKISDVEIDSFGNIKGWSDYSIIKVNTDAVFGGEDGIRLSTGNNQGAINYVVEFIGDKVIIYEALEDKEKPTSKRGKKVHSLIRDNVGVTK